MRQYVVMPLKDQCLNHPSVQAGLKSLSCFTHRKHFIWFSNLNMPLFLYYLLGNLLNKWLDKSFGILINNLTNCQMFTKKYSQPTESNAFSAWRLRTKCLLEEPCLVVIYYVRKYVLKSFFQLLRRIVCSLFLLSI